MRELTPLEYLQVQAKKQKQAELIRQRGFIEKPDPVPPDAICYAYDKPKHAFFTEGKAYQALIVAKQRRLAEGSTQVEKRFYECKHAYGLTRIREKHFHLTSMTATDYQQEQDDVHQD